MRELKADSDEFEEAFTMSNIRPKHTGLPMVIWVSPKTGKEKHGPRIKAQTTHGDKAQMGNWVTVTVEENPQVIGEGLDTGDTEAVKAFVKRNKETLLKLWSDELDPLDLPKFLKQ